MLSSQRALAEDKPEQVKLKHCDDRTFWQWRAWQKYKACHTRVLPGSVATSRNTTMHIHHSRNYSTLPNAGRPAHHERTNTEKRTRPGTHCECAHARACTLPHAAVGTSLPRSIFAMALSARCSPISNEHSGKHDILAPVPPLSPSISPPSAPPPAHPQSIHTCSLPPSLILPGQEAGGGWGRVDVGDGSWEGGARGEGAGRER